MTTDCITEFPEDTRADLTQGLADKATEYGAAVIAALGIILLVPAASLIMSIIHSA